MSTPGTVAGADTSPPLQAPFPWFGGKREAAATIWERFGDVPNYVDPFCGSLAVPLLRPHSAKTETVNDADGLLVNFWRSVAADPEAVARWADWPVSEADLHPRHAHLVARRDELAERLQGDAEFFDAKLAGWWVWGQCAWIGTGWCSGEGPWTCEDGRLVRRNPGQGIKRQLPHLWRGRGINRQLPHLGNPGRGINRQLLPHLGDPGRGDLFEQGDKVAGWLRSLQARTRRMRITCGDWRRVLTPAVTYRHGTTAVLLDPPYVGGLVSYTGGGDMAHDVAEWARENGNDERLRIALCGHEGDHDFPGWDAVGWKARGGYGNQGGDDEDDNRHRETIWFSPGCLAAQQGRLW